MGLKAPFGCAAKRYATLWLALFAVYFLLGNVGAPFASAVPSARFGVETSGFLLSSLYRENGWSSFFAGVDLSPDSSEDSELAPYLDARAYLSIKQARSLTLHVPAAYLSWTPAGHELGIGRRALHWSRSDERWDLGIFNPRFLWNPLRPEDDALTGLFYQFHHPRFRITAFASIVTLPELGHSVVTSSGRLRSSSPWFVPPANYSSLLGTNLEISYSLLNPDLQKALLRSSAIVRGEWRVTKDGIWLAAAGGMLPIHQADLALDAYLDLSDTRLHADLLPRFGSRRVALFEGGYQGKDWNFWFSLLRETPHYPSPPEKWMTRPAGPATSVSVGADIDWKERLNLSTSVLWVSETPHVQPKQLMTPGAEGITLPGRFPFERALLLAARWRSWSRLPEPGIQWVLDLENRGGLLFGDVSWRIHQAVVTSFGFEYPYSPTSIGWFGGYREQDRIWGRISYEL